MVIILEIKVFHKMKLSKDVNDKKCYPKLMYLTLIGMRGDTFTSLSFLDEILSAEFLSKRSKHFGGKNWHHSGYFDTLPSLLSLLNVALGASKNGHFSFFQRSCQLGLSENDADTFYSWKLTIDYFGAFWQPVWKLVKVEPKKSSSTDFWAKLFFQFKLGY